MIKSKRITGVSARLPADTANEKYINVLTWHPPGHVNGSKYYRMSPYFLKTDGEEEQNNKGGVLFENFWQGSKVWPVMYSNTHWAHPSLKGKADQFKWFSYDAENGAEVHLDHNDKITPNYYKWRSKLFECPNPIRYPNGFRRQKEVKFSLLCPLNKPEERLSYLEARDRIYVREYCRLVRKEPEYLTLLNLLRANKTLIICEIDVPDNNQLSMDVLNFLQNSTTKPFGHGLCLAKALLEDLENN